MDALIERHADDIRRIARQHGAGHVRVFGSRAIRTATTSSDVDFLVDFETGRDLLDIVALKQEEALLGCHVDVVEEGGVSPYVRDRILNEARPL
jgi:predicted nucleotidyltransferase